MQTRRWRTRDKILTKTWRWGLPWIQSRALGHLVHTSSSAHTWQKREEDTYMHWMHWMNTCMFLCFYTYMYICMLLYFRMCTWLYVYSFQVILSTSLLARYMAWAQILNDDHEICAVDKERSLWHCDRWKFDLLYGRVFELMGKYRGDKLELWRWKVPYVCVCVCVCVYV